MKKSYQPTQNSMLRSGFTMIELIFVIVIIGILSSIAIPKMVATRNDAKLSTNVSNMDSCIRECSAHYMSTIQDYTQANHPHACDLDNTECYDIRYSVNGIDFNVTTNTSRKSFCSDIENVGGHLARSYTFGGRTIIR